MTAGEAVGLDVGGTKINAFRVSRDGTVLDRRTGSTPAEDTEATLAWMIELATQVMTDDVLAVGVGAAGMVDADDGVLRFAPNLAWRELPIRTRMREALQLPVLVDNDATVAVYAEYRFGAGRGYRHLLLVTVGTGIGGGIVSDGRLFRGAHGFAAEIGHIIVEPNGPPCGCGNRGCWEQVAAGQAIARLGRDAAATPEGAAILGLVDGDAGRVTGAVVTRAATGGDPAATAILGEVGRRLGEGIAGLLNVLDPQLVVVGGGVIQGGGELILGPARAACERSIEAPDHRPNVPIVQAEFGNDAGAIGAATLALEELART